MLVWKLRRASSNPLCWKQGYFFPNKDIPAYRSDGCGTVRRQKHAFNCKYVLTFSQHSVRIKACAHMSWNLLMLSLSTVKKADDAKEDGMAVVLRMSSLKNRWFCFCCACKFHDTRELAFPDSLFVCFVFRMHERDVENCNRNLFHGCVLVCMFLVLFFSISVDIYRDMVSLLTGLVWV